MNVGMKTAYAHAQIQQHQELTYTRVGCAKGVTTRFFRLASAKVIWRVSSTPSRKLNSLKYKKQTSK